MEGDAEGRGRVGFLQGLGHLSHVHWGVEIFVRNALAHVLIVSLGVLINQRLLKKHKKTWAKVLVCFLQPKKLALLYICNLKAASLDLPVVH